MIDKQTKDNIPINSLYWLGGGLVLATLPHSLRIPFWIMPLFLALCVWKLYLSSQKHLKEKKFSATNILVFILLVVGVTGIYHHFGTLLGRTAGVSLLILLAGFKIFEINHERDFYVGCFLGYFLIVTNFLFTQTIGTAVYMACTVLVMTLSLVLFNDTQGKLSYKASGKIAAALLLQSIPVMLILFLSGCSDYDKAVKFEKNGNSTYAIESYKIYLAGNPTDMAKVANAQYALGMLFTKEGKKEEAVSFFASAIASGYDARLVNSALKNHVGDIKSNDFSRTRKLLNKIQDINAVFKEYSLGQLKRLEAVEKDIAASHKRKLVQKYITDSKNADRKSVV